VVRKLQKRGFSIVKLFSATRRGGGVGVRGRGAGSHHHRYPGGHEAKAELPKCRKSQVKKSAGWGGNSEGRGLLEEKERAESTPQSVSELVLGAGDTIMEEGSGGGNTSVTKLESLRLA